MNTRIHHLPELDPRMKLLLVVFFASVTFSAPNILALIADYFEVKEETAHQIYQILF